MEADAPQRATILAADHDQYVLQFCRQHLVKAGYAAIGVKDGAEAIEWLKANEPPALVLVGAMMPRVDGLEVIRWIRADQRLCRIPIVMVTARSPFVGDTPRVRENGADDVLLKPFKGDDLVAVLERVLTGFPIASGAIGANNGMPDRLVGQNSLAPDALHRATIAGDMDRVRTLLDAGADVNARDSYGDTPLVRAGQYGRPETIGLLIACGADVSTEGGLAARALTRAVAFATPAAVCALLDGGVDVSARLGGGWDAGQTALHRAVAHRRPEMVRLLLDRGADANAIDAEGRKPLDLAGQGRAWTEVRRMLEEPGT